MNYRLQELDVKFYNIDFPSVIEKRKELLGQSAKEQMIGMDITNLDWTKQIDLSLPF